MSFDFEPNPWDDAEEEEGEWGGRQPSRFQPRCRTCDRVCSWAFRRGRWVLMDDLTPHRCTTADQDFEEE